MTYMSYTKWRPDITWPEVFNTGCGTLTYKLVHRSWANAWEGNDVMLRPIGSSYFSDKGTIHIVEAEKRFQIGDHEAWIEVASDLVPFSTK